ncbi:hypothetical protein ACVWZK_005575 [Bradyrhizobium sp. GM0.4]
MPAFGALGIFVLAGALLGVLGRILACILARISGGRRLIAIIANAEHAGEHTDHTADRAAEHTADRTRRLVPGRRSFLNPFDQALSVRHRGCAEQQHENGPQREPSSQVKPRGRRRVDHSGLHLDLIRLLGMRTTRQLQLYRFHRFEV